MPVWIKPFDHADPLVIRQRQLPHWRQDGCAYFVTCHLGDSLPANILRLWTEIRRNWLELHPPPWSDATPGSTTSALRRKWSATSMPAVAVAYFATRNARGRWSKRLHTATAPNMTLERS